AAARGPPAGPPSGCVRARRGLRWRPIRYAGRELAERSGCTERPGSSRSFRCPMRLPQRIGPAEGSDDSGFLPVLSLEGLPDLAQRPLLHGAFEPVDVEGAVELPDLVLDEAGHQALPRQLDLGSLHVRARAARVGGTSAREEQSGDGQAALVVVLQLLGELDDDGVEDAAQAALLPEVPGEGAQAHADLVGGHPGAALVVDGVQQVLHEGAGAVGDLPDRVAGGAQHRVADDADGADGHACSASSAPSTRWVTSAPGTTVRSTVQPAATARRNTVTTAAPSFSVSPSSGSCTSSAIVRYRFCCSSEVPCAHSRMSKSSPRRRARFTSLLIPAQ